ncbi:hypothetical protein [Spirosoma aerophilum]
MRYLTLSLFALFAQCGSKSLKGDETDPQVDSNKVKVTVTFDSAPVAPTVAVADLKYNKTLGFALVKDDGGPGDWTTVYPYIWGGVGGDGVTYPGMTYTDGTGRPVKWHWTFALNWNDGQIANATSTAKHLEMMKVGFADISNHSLTHTGTYNRAYEVKANEVNIYKYLGGYRTRTFTIPTAFEGFVETSFAMNYLLTASQGYGPGGASSDGNNESGKVNVLWGERVKSNETRRLITTRRFFGDGWGDADLANAKSFVDGAFAASTGTTADTKFVYQAFSHGPTFSTANPAQFANFRTFVQYIASNPLNKDNVWVTGLQEFVEYNEVKRDVGRSQTVNDKTMTVTLDYAGVDPNTRWRDLSLLVGGGPIKSVAVSGADDFTFNPATGLVNIYKKKTTGFSDPAQDVLPPALSTVKTSSDHTLDLVFNRPVTQDMAAGWAVTSGGVDNPVAELTGSGTTWQLKVKNTLLTGQPILVDYRLQRGNAMDASTRQKVVAYIGFPATNRL